MVWIFYRVHPNTLGREPIEYRLRMAKDLAKARTIVRSLERSGFKVHYDSYEPTLFDTQTGLVQQLKRLPPGHILIAEPSSEREKPYVNKS